MAHAGASQPQPGAAPSSTSQHKARPRPPARPPATVDHDAPADAPLGSHDHQLSPRRVDLLQPGTWGEWLQDLGGIWLHRRHAATAGWALRGGFGGQVAVRFDGVPLLGALQSLEPSRQLLTIDPRIIGQLALTRGPSSHRLGNHAFAGAIELQSLALPRPTGTRTWRFSGRARGSYQSADQAPEGHLTLSLAGTGGGVLLAGGGGIHGVLTTGGNTGSIHQSDYTRAHALGTFEWKWGHTSLKALYLFGQIDDSKYTELFYPQSDVSRYRERRHLAYLQLYQGIGRGHIEAQVAYQFLDSYDYSQDIALGSRAIQASRELALPRHLVSARLMGRFQSRRIQIDAQAEFLWERLQVETLSQSGQQRLLPYPFPTQGERSSLAFAVGMQLFALRGPVALTFDAGGRIHPHWDALTPPRGPVLQEGFSRLHIPWAAQAGMTLADARKRWQLRLFYATGYRVPSWQEQAGAGPQGQIEWDPTNDLMPEFNHSFEARATFQWRRRLRLTLRSFVQLWQQRIGLRPTTTGRQSRTYPVVQHANSDQLLPSVGIESMAWVRIWRGWSARASLTWLHLFDTALQTTPQHIWPTTPPISGLFATRYQFGRWGGIEAMMQVVAGQPTRHAPLSLQLLLGQKNPVYRPWTVFTVRANLRITRYLQLVANLENLSNQPYLRYGALIYAPGINYRFQLIGQW